MTKEKIVQFIDEVHVWDDTSKERSTMKRKHNKYKLLDMIESVVVDVGTFRELSKNNGIDINRIQWSYYQGFIFDKRYLVTKEEKVNE